MSNCRQNYIFSFYLRYFSLKKYHFSPLCRLPLAQTCLLASPCDANDTGENTLRRSGKIGMTPPSRTLLSAKGLLSPDDMAPFAGRYGSFRRTFRLLSPNDMAPFAPLFRSTATAVARKTAARDCSLRGRFRMGCLACELLRGAVAAAVAVLCRPSMPSRQAFTSFVSASLFFFLPKVR